MRFSNVTTLNMLLSRVCYTRCLIFVLLIVLCSSVASAEDVVSTESIATTKNPIDEKPIILTGLGYIQGSALRSRLGKLFYGFRGIRYAKAPVGDLRFKVGPKKKKLVMCKYKIKEIFRHLNQLSNGMMFSMQQSMVQCVHNQPGMKQMCQKIVFALMSTQIMYKSKAKILKKIY